MAKRGKRNRLPPFIALGRLMLKSEAWRKGLTFSQKIAYIHLKYKYVGINNGDICLHYSEMKDVMASATLCTALKGLEEKEWIVRDRIIGGKYRFEVRYRLTGKYDTTISSFNR